MPHDIRVLAPEQLRAAQALFSETLLFAPLDDETWARAQTALAVGRTLGAFDGPALVGTVVDFPTRTAVPGGGDLETAAVTRVGVRADHTRRGLLSAMMARQLADVAADGVPLASLRASEARIYGRFGYGVATRGRSVAVSGRRGWRPTAPPGGTVRLLDRTDMVDTLVALHDRIALRRPGGITRSPHWWSRVVGEPLVKSQHLLVAVHTGADGDDGFALAAVEPGDGLAGRTLRVRDLHAADVDAEAGLWRFLLDIDLIDDVVADLRPLDEPLELLLADPRGCATTAVEDETWLRLVDVPAALAARGWGTADPVRIAVHDRLLPANSGTYRIGDGVHRDTGPADLECDVDALAMAYLGDRAPSRLAATGWWRVHDAAALARADALFATPAPPWCGTYF